MKKRRLPVVLQMSAVECGPACLAMVLGYYGRKTRLEECRKQCDPGRDGATARTVLHAARGFGLEAKGFSLSIDALRRLPMPCIVHWKANHFVVVERFAASSVLLVDPGQGRLLLTLEEFEAGFSGTALTFEPGSAFLTHPTPVRPHLLLDYLRRSLFSGKAKGLLGQVLGASLLLQAFGFALPLLTKEIIDRILPSGKLGELNFLLAGAALVAIVNGAVAYFRSLVLVRLERGLDARLMLGFFDHLLSLPFRFFQERQTGDLLMRLGSNAMIREALASYSTSAILDGSLVLVLLVAMWHISPQIGCASLLLAAFEVGVLRVTMPRLQSLTEADLACQSASQSSLVESLMGISTLKAAGAEQLTLRRWRGQLEKQLDAAAQRSRYFASVDAIVLVLRSFAPLFLLWLAGRLVLAGSLSLGTALALNALAAAFLQPVSSLVLGWQRLQLAGVHLERIADVMQAEPEQAAGSAHAAPSLTGRIEVRNLSFRYDTHSPDVLHNVSFRIEAGQKVALVGRTASGKSTLAKLLLGLYFASEGEILYDGTPLQTLPLQNFRRQWGAALQDSALFSSSIRENVAMHDPNMPMRDVERAATVAAIHHEIEEMPMGYETPLEQAGMSLSGGQRQRLAIARAVAHKPALLLLDEATSHLDVLTESRVDKNLDTLACTRVVIAHRLSTVQNADLILVLEQGRVVEQGTHETLLRQNGHYATLIASQLQHSRHVEDRVECLAG